ncbi:hypothetical protein AA0111_g1833 [Alternaria arborescens]|uniref:hypothetical protein n=1 Tax=Alternaria arborescens TaxID=156630 RepID=UPI0010753A0C|nr:hypothetical protein AA0111_g1833 [Alternaria arborescens]RYO39275.1 hypothetical protein AA0111_g1833 [Alternaria arborescens]
MITVRIPGTLTPNLDHHMASSTTMNWESLAIEVDRLHLGNRPAEMNFKGIVEDPAIDLIADL